MEIVVRTENELNFNWFKKGISSEFKFTFEKIPNPGDPKFLNLPEKLKNILRLDKPDLIISKKNENIERWNKIKRYKYRYMLFYNYLHFIYSFARLNNSKRCVKLIDDIAREKVSLKWHKKNSIKDIRRKWSN